MGRFRHQIHAALLPVVAAIALAVTAAPVQASYVTGGNTQPQNQTGGVGGTVNFAVYQSTAAGIAAGDPYGLGSAALSTTFLASFTGTPVVTAGTYLYIFQTTNDGTNNATEDISANTVAVGAGSIIPGSFGVFNQYGFTVPIFGTPAGRTNPSPFSLSASAPSLGTSAGFSNPAVTITPNSIVASYSNGGGALGPDGDGGLFGFFSTQAPTLSSPTSMEDGGTNASGTVLTAGPTVPEPSSMLLLGLALPIGVLLRKRLARG
jgi:hypothetical protein